MPPPESMLPPPMMFQRYFSDLQTRSLELWYNPQFVICRNNDDLQTENQVLRQFGSYGKQLSTILRVIDVIVARLPQGELTPGERHAVRDFQKLVEQVRTVVGAQEGARSEGITRSDIHRLAKDLRTLKYSNPAVHRALVNELTSDTDIDTDEEG
jgi:hypothetical protein